MAKPLKNRSGLALAKGFTLVELLLTLAILAVLATLVTPVLQVELQRDKERALRQNLQEIRQALDAYKRASDQGLIKKDLGSSGYPPNLEVLVEGVTDQTDPNGKKIYFLRRIPGDPFAEDVSGNPVFSWGLRSYQSPAENPSPGDDVFDVHTRSTRLGLNGIALNKW